MTVEDRYQMPRVDELVERIGKAEFISTLDLCKGYYQVPMRAEDKPKTAFLTPFGKFQFCRMPFGDPQCFRIRSLITVVVSQMPT